MLILQYVQLLVRIQNLIRNGNKQVKKKIKSISLYLFGYWENVWKAKNWNSK